MYFPFVSPLRGIGGRFGKQPYTFVVRNGNTYIRREVKAKDPRTPAQLAMRALWTQAKKGWSQNLTRPQRDAWELWAREKLVAPGLASGGGPVGFNAFPKVQQYRIVLNLPDTGDAPAGDLPGTLVEVQQESAPGAEANAVCFRLMHNEPSIGAMHVLVETTPAMPTMRRKPREGELRWSAGVSTGSFLPLQVSGENYVLSGGIHSVQPGQRFGLRMRLISPEGVPGRAVRLDWIKALPAGSTATPDSATSAAPSAEPAPAPPPPGVTPEPKSMYTASYWNRISDSPPRRAGETLADARKRARRATRIKKERAEAWWLATEFKYGLDWLPPWMPREISHL